MSSTLFSVLGGIHKSEAFTANNSSPTMSRYVCELMSTNLTIQYMASHSLSDQNGVKGLNCSVDYKPAIDRMYVKKLIGMNINPCPVEYLEVFFKDIFLKQYYSTTN